MQIYTLKFCRVCGFRVRVWGSYIQNFQKVRVLVRKCYKTSRISGYCGTGIQNSQKFWAGTKHAVPVPRVLWHGSHRTHRSSGYGYESLTGLPVVPGTGMKVLQYLQNFRVLWNGRTELPKVPGRYQHAVPVPRVLVAPAYRTSTSSGYGYKFPTEVTEILCEVIPGANTPGMVLCVPYRQNKNKKFGYGYECRTELQTFRVRVGLYRTHKSPGYGKFPGKYPPQKGRKNSKLTWSKIDTIVNAFPITAIGILHTLHSKGNNIYVYYNRLSFSNTDHTIAYPGCGA